MENEELMDEKNSLISVLLQYRHMFLFLRNHYLEEIDYCLNNLKKEFNSNAELCQKMLDDIVVKDEKNNNNKEMIEFIKSKESIYGLHKKFVVIDQNKNLHESSIMKSFMKKRSIIPKLNPALSKSKMGPIKINKNLKQGRNSSNIIVQNSNVIKRKNKTETKKYSEGNVLKNNSTSTSNTLLSKNNNNVDSINEPKIKFIKPTFNESDCDDNTVDLFGIAIKYICSYGCRFRSTSQDKVKAHELMIHAGHVHKCSQNDCSKQFISVYDLEKHMMETHGIFKCSNEICGQEFANEFQLKKHVKNEHEKEYLTCKVCNVKFRTRDGIRKHIYIKHESGDFHCDHEGCNFSATYRRELENHKRVKHLLKKCCFAGCDRLVSKSYYARHLRLHQKIKTYLCSWPDCGKLFSDNKSLKDHVRVHLNFKRYRCKWPNCTYACEQQSNLITHVRVRHFKLPQTKKRQLELNISLDSFPNPYQYLETVNEDICMSTKI